MNELKIGIVTCSWYDESNPQTSIKTLKECGFDTIDLSFTDKTNDSFDEKTCTTFFDKSLEELCEYYKPLKDSLRDNEMCFSQAHGSDPIHRSLEADKCECSLRATKRQIGICQYLNCPLIVVHLWRDLNVSKEEEMEINLNTCRKLIPTAKKCGVKICLENIYKGAGSYYLEGSCSDAAEAIYYIDTLNKEAGEEIFGACLDTGHIHLLRRNLYKHIKALGKRILAVHIHENVGVEDTHMIPYTQLDIHEKNTAIDWERFLKGLKEIGFKGTISFETYRGLRTLPVECRKEGLQLISSIGRYFRKRILETRGESNEN